MNKVIQAATGFIFSFFTVIFAGGGLYSLQGERYHFKSYFYGLTHAQPFFFTWYQIGIAINIGLFFLLINKPKWFWACRGLSAGTVLQILFIAYILIFVN